MTNLSKTIAQYNDLWGEAVISTGKKDCTPSLVLLTNIDYYKTCILNPSISYRFNQNIYQSLETPPAWKHLNISEKMAFYADYLYKTAIKAPYLLSPKAGINRYINTTTASGYFGDFIIKTTDSTGNETPIRSLVSFDCITFTLLLDIKKLLCIKNYITSYPNKRADYIRRNILDRPIKTLEQSFNHKIPYMFVVEENKTASDRVHIHGMMKITAEDLSIYDTKRRYIENILLKAALGKDYNHHPLVKNALKIILPYHPLGWASYICKSIPNKADIYVSKSLRAEGQKLYNEYRETVKDLIKIQKKSPRKKQYSSLRACPSFGCF